MKKNLYTFVLIISFATASAQIVNIPDANFKAYLLDNQNININRDNEIQVSEAENFTGLLDCNNKSITDLTGVEAFINLTDLYCYNNPLKTLDISKNINLINLWCESNQLTNLDVSKNISLKRIDCGKNQLKSLDISKNIVLEALHYNENQITNFDYSLYPQLKSIDCSGNQVTSLDISKNTNLIRLTCSNNQLTTLDISKNLLLTYLIFNNNQINTLDVSKHTDLIYLTCDYNFLESLDLSKNTELISLACIANRLTTLNVKNGQNHKIQFFAASGNPDLHCIQVDDVAYSNNNWFNNWANYSTDCSLSVDDVQKSEIQIYPNPAKDKFTINTNDKIEQVEIYSLTGQILKTAKSKEINISDLSKGNYIVKVKTDKSNYSQKLIKN